MANIVRPAWMTNEMYAEWYEYYLDAGGTGVTGSAERATEVFRSSAKYATYFPGLLRDDGATRYATNPEATYFANLASFRTTVQAVGVDPALIGKRYIELIEGDVSPAEFERRVGSLQSRVLGQADSIRNWYGANYGINMTSAGMIASLMDDEVGAAILEERLTMAEIGGEGALHEYDVSTEFANMLEDNGMSRDEAGKLFGTAEQLLPVLDSLAKRHGDPDDDFDIKEFARGTYLMDSEQSSRIGRLTAQERSVFTGSATTGVVTDREVGVVGLRQS